MTRRALLADLLALAALALASWCFFHFGYP
jgi:hypothetical protein